MTGQSWFSSKLRFAVVVDTIGNIMLNDCLYLLVALDFEEAFDKVLDIGFSAEKRYPNADGQIVSWQFKEVVSLDVIQSGNLDGSEIYSEFVTPPPGDVGPTEGRYDPRASKPMQTI